MISEFIFVPLFFIVAVSVRASDLVNYDDLNITSCTKVLTREYGHEVNFKLGNVYTITMCPESYTSNITIKRKCETTDLPKAAILEDIFLFTLALDRINRSKLYFNVYCAICHDEKVFYQFPPYFQYQLDTNVSDSKSIEEDKKYYPVSDHTSLLSNLKLNEQGKELISFNKTGFRYKFTPYRVLIIPKRSKNMFKEPMLTARAPYVPYCSRSPTHDFKCEYNSSRINHCYYQDANHSNIFNLQLVISDLNKEPGRSKNATFCPEKYIDAGRDSSHCKYEDKNGYICWWNRFLKKGVDYVEGDKGEIFFVDNYTMLNMTPDEYTVHTGYKDVIYLCGVDQYKDHANQYCIEIINSIQCLLRRFSLFCVIVYLLINGHRRALIKLVDKITYSYYVTLFMMYCREEIAEAVKNASCFLEYTAYRYLLQSYTFWIIIATWYLWIIIRSPGAEHAMNENVCKTRLIYLSMCMIAWVLPAVFILLFYAFDSIPTCPVMPGYNNLKLCKPSDEPDAYYWFIFGMICIISVIVSAQFVTSCYHYQFGKIRDENEIGVTDWTTRMVFFFKIVYSIGLYMMLLAASMINRGGAVYSILLHLWSFHGTLIFFLYSFKMTVMKSMLAKRGSPEGAAEAERCGIERRCESKETVFAD